MALPTPTVADVKAYLNNVRRRDGIAGDVDDWEFNLYAQMPQQIKADCGVFMCNAIRSLCEGGRVETYDADDMVYLRSRMAHEIFAGELMPSAYKARYDNPGLSEDEANKPVIPAEKIASIKTKWGTAGEDNAIYGLPENKEIRHESLKRLEPSGFIDDDVVNLYLNLVQRGVIYRATGEDRFPYPSREKKWDPTGHPVILNSFWMAEGWGEQKDAPRERPELRGVYPSIFSANWIILPANDPGVHWWFYLADTRRKTITAFDSLMPDGGSGDARYTVPAHPPTLRAGSPTPRAGSSTPTAVVIESSPESSPKIAATSPGADPAGRSVARGSKGSLVGKGQQKRNERWLRLDAIESEDSDSEPDAGGEGNQPAMKTPAKAPRRLFPSDSDESSDDLHKGATTPSKLRTVSPIPSAQARVRAELRAIVLRESAELPEMDPPFLDANAVLRTLKTGDYLEQGDTLQEMREQDNYDYAEDTFGSPPKRGKLAARSVETADNIARGAMPAGQPDASFIFSVAQSGKKNPEEKNAYTWEVYNRVVVRMHRAAFRKLKTEKTPGECAHYVSYIDESYSTTRNNLTRALDGLHSQSAPVLLDAAGREGTAEHVAKLEHGDAPFGQEVQQLLQGNVADGELHKLVYYGVRDQLRLLLGGAASVGEFGPQENLAGDARAYYLKAAAAGAIVVPNRDNLTAEKARDLLREIKIDGLATGEVALKFYNVAMGVPRVFENVGKTEIRSLLESKKTIFDNLSNVCDPKTAILSAGNGHLGRWLRCFPGTPITNITPGLGNINANRAEELIASTGYYVCWFTKDQIHYIQNVWVREWHYSTRPSWRLDRFFELVVQRTAIDMLVEHYTSIPKEGIPDFMKQCGGSGAVGAPPVAPATPPAQRSVQKKRATTSPGERGDEEEKEEEDAFDEHIVNRLKKLGAMLSANPVMNAVISADPKNLDEPDIGASHIKAAVARRLRSFKEVANKDAGRNQVSFGEVSARGPKGADGNTIQVWSANLDNYMLPAGKGLVKDGDASESATRIRISGPLEFGIIAAPTHKNELPTEELLAEKNSKLFSWASIKTKLGAMKKKATMNKPNQDKIRAAIDRPRPLTIYIPVNDDEPPTEFDSDWREVCAAAALSVKNNKSKWCKDLEVVIDRAYGTVTIRKKQGDASCRFAPAAGV